MRIAVTGAAGQLGRDLVPAIRSRGHEAVPFTRSELDVTRSAAVEAALVREKPDALIHAAAYTAVDEAEAWPDRTFAVNRDGTRYVAAACLRAGIPLVFVSTDYVFDGEKRSPYVPGDPTHPLNVYGVSKLAAERCIRDVGAAHLIVRTSWLYGAQGSNFVTTVLRLARDRGRLQMVDDQRGSPTWTGTLAEALVDLTASGARGVLHVTDRTENGSGSPGISRLDFALAILVESRLAVPVEGVPAGALPRAARRPTYSVLDIGEAEKRLGRPFPDWRDSLRRMLAQLRGEVDAAPGGMRTKGPELEGREP